MTEHRNELIPGEPSEFTDEDSLLDSMIEDARKLGDKMIEDARKLGD
ncbi:MAG: hypothetical protein EZS28_035131, partial [Streblomastix strix]